MYTTNNVLLKDFQTHIITKTQHSPNRLAFSKHPISRREKFDLSHSELQRSPGYSDHPMYACTLPIWFPLRLGQLWTRGILLLCHTAALFPPTLQHIHREPPKNKCDKPLTSRHKLCLASSHLELYALPRWSSFSPSICKHHPPASIQTDCLCLLLTLAPAHDVHPAKTERISAPVLQSISREGAERRQKLRGNKKKRKNMKSKAVGLRIHSCLSV